MVELHVIACLCRYQYLIFVISSTTPPHETFIMNKIIFMEIKILYICTSYIIFFFFVVLFSCLIYIL